MTRKPLAAVLTTAMVGGVLALAAPGASAAPDKAGRAEQAVRHAHDQVALDDNDGLAARDVVTDGDGTTHVRFDRTRGGLPVIGGDMVVHQAADGALKGVSATTRKELRLSLTPAVSRDQAIATAREAADNGATGISSAGLQIDSRDASPRLVWAVVVLGQQEDQTPSELLTLVDAQNGRVVDTHEQVEQVDGTGTGLWNGTVTLRTTQSGSTYTMEDPLAPGQKTYDLKNGTTGTGSLYTGADNLWGDVASEKAAVDAHYGASKTFDYYRTTFGRNGIANDGRGAYSRVHYGVNYDNAFWTDSCFCMTYGDGDPAYGDGPLVSLDVAGHEMSHGVTSRTANLTYSGESGGLNEATSDIFGTMVEFAAGGTSDPGDYDIGEQFTGGHPFRFMYDPIKDGSSPNCYSKSLGRLNVHYSSGVANRFFFLLAEGTRSPLGDGVAGCSGAADVTGVGRTVAAQIWYRALTVYMTSRTKYADAKLATQSAARDLVGTTVKAADGTTVTVPSNAVDVVTAAWRAVNVV